jgi:hypothetical protein
MDPYLEAHWLDVHTKLVAYSADALNTALPEELIARTEERVAIESDSELRSISPDVRVFSAAIPDLTEPSAEGGIALAPYRLVAVEPITERFIEIIDTNGERLVTVVEFVSPTNKRGKGLDAFVQKREELLSGGVNIVEIDLTRSGDWQELLLPQICRGKLVSTYRAVIRVPQDPQAAYLYPISLRTPLPAIKIPLRKDETPVELALQPLLDQAYQNGRYARTLNYSRPPEPPLDAESAAWADALLRGEAGKRE